MNGKDVLQTASMTPIRDDLKTQGSTKWQGQRRAGGMQLLEGGLNMFLYCRRATCRGT